MGWKDNKNNFWKKQWNKLICLLFGHNYYANEYFRVITFANTQSNDRCERINEIRCLRCDRLENMTVSQVRYDNLWGR
jgi:hypothetical protein